MLDLVLHVANEAAEAMCFFIVKFLLELKIVGESYVVVAFEVDVVLQSFDGGEEFIGVMGWFVVGHGVVVGGVGVICVVVVVVGGVVEEVDVV